MAMKEGDSYYSYEEFSEALDKFKRETFAVFTVADSCLVELRNKRSLTVPPLPERLKYSRLRLGCVHHNKNKFNKQKPKATGPRPNQKTLALGCPAEIYISADPATDRLVVKRLSNQHNHKLSEELQKRYAAQRRLADGDKEAYGKMLDFGVDVKNLTQFIQNTTGQVVLTKDLYNLRQQRKRNAQGLRNIGGLAKKCKNQTLDCDEDTEAKRQAALNEQVSIIEEEKAIFGDQEEETVKGEDPGSSTKEDEGQACQDQVSAIISDFISMEEEAAGKKSKKDPAPSGRSAKRRKRKVLNCCKDKGGKKRQALQTEQMAAIKEEFLLWKQEQEAREQQREEDRQMLLEELRIRERMAEEDRKLRREELAHAAKREEEERKLRLEDIRLRDVREREAAERQAAMFSELLTVLKPLIDGRTERDFSRNITPREVAPQDDHSYQDKKPVDLNSPL